MVFLGGVGGGGGGGWGGGTPTKKPYRSVLPRFGVKTGIDFVHFGLESGMVF